MAMVHENESHPCLTRVRRIALRPLPELDPESKGEYAA